MNFKLDRPLVSFAYVQLTEREITNRYFGLSTFSRSGDGRSGIKEKKKGKARLAFKPDFQYRLQVEPVVTTK